MKHPRKPAEMIVSGALWDMYLSASGLALARVDPCFSLRMCVCIDAHMLTNRSQHFINCSPQPGHYTFQQLSISYNYMWIWYVLIVYIIYIYYVYISILYIYIIHKYNIKRISYITHIYIFTHYSHYRHITWNIYLRRWGCQRLWHAHWMAFGQAEHTSNIIKYHLLNCTEGSFPTLIPPNLNHQL